MTATQAPTPGPLSAAERYEQAKRDFNRMRDDGSLPECDGCDAGDRCMGVGNVCNPTAPVEASGSEQLKARATHGEYSLHNFPDDPDADHSVWSIFHTTDSGGLEVASGMDRATADLLLAALRPQPSGETR